MNTKRMDSPYVNRELSWIRFNERVLEEAEDQRLPLFERMRFLSIFGSNLDEFFMVRVGGLYDAMVLSPEEVDSKSKMTPAQQLEMIYQEMTVLMPRVEKCYETLSGLLRQQGIYQIDTENVTPYQESVLERFFRDSVKPFLAPQIIDKHHPFPFLSNKEQFIGIEFETNSNKIEIAVIPVVSKNFPRYFIFPDESGTGYCFVTAAGLIYYFADMIFKKKIVKDKFVFRVTRNGDLRVDEALFDEEIDWRDQMEKIIKKRKRSAVVRLQMSKAVSVELEHFLLKKLGAKRQSLFVTPLLPLSLNFIYGLLGELQDKYTEFNYSPMPPIMPAGINPGDSIVKYLDNHGDILLAYPYHSMKTFLDLLDESAVDPSVTSIRITLYRIASGSKVAQALSKAAENGKDVLVLVELKARFDEEHNIIWSKRLEEAGCRVIYGFDNYKVHSKLCVISRQTGHGISHITQIGTGNYNEKTARQYTDFSLITTNQEIAAEALNVFTTLSMGQFVERSKYLLVAPLQMRNRFIELIDREIEAARTGAPARIVAKINGLSQRDIIDKLIEASQAGVDITLYVRGICCLRAGIPGLTDHITIKSMVGRFLEHPRLFLFGFGERQRMYIGSADWMTRNLNYRVEVAVEILDPAIKQVLYQVLEIMAADNTLARMMQPDGTYKRLYPAQNEKVINSQTEQYALFKRLKNISQYGAVDQSKEEKVEPVAYHLLHQEHKQDVDPAGSIAEEARSSEVSNLPAKKDTDVTLIEMPKGFWARLKLVLFGKV